MVQVEGDAMRISADVLKKEADKDGALQNILSLYNIALQTQIGYSSPATVCTPSKNAAAVGCS